MYSTDSRMSLFTKIIFWFVAINALAGALSLMLFPTYTDRLFFWEIKPPLSAALFGALYLGGAGAVSWVTYKGAWEPARFLVPVLVSAGILISIITFMHLDKFEPGFKLFYWLVVYIAAPLLALVIYLLQERNGASWTSVQPVTLTTRLLAVTVGILVFLAGVLVIIWPGVVVENWPWPTAPLMLRIFAAWFSAFGVGLIWFLFEPDWQRLRYIPDLMIAAAGLDLVMLFIHRGDLTSFGLNLWLYGLHLGLFGLLGLLLHALQRMAAHRVELFSISSDISH